MRILIVVLVLWVLSGGVDASISPEKNKPWTLFSRVTCDEFTLFRMKRDVGILVQDKLDYELNGTKVLSVLAEPGIDLFDSNLVVRVYGDKVVYVFSDVTYDQYLHIASEIIKSYGGSALQLKLAACGTNY